MPDVRFGSSPGVRVPVRLAEWAELRPATDGAGRVLLGLSFGSDARARAQASELSRAGVLVVTERLEGLAIETRSFVGRLTVGPLDVTIVPKISWARWLTLVGYALRLRGLRRTGRLDLETDAVPLQDLIILELVSEARDLLARGLHREYVRLRASLSTPRGRIDFVRVARTGGVTEPAVPCRFTRRADDSPLNRALLAGLHLAARRAQDRALRSDARRLAHELERTVVPELATRELLGTARKALDRRTRRYEPALRLIELLIDGTAVSLDDDSEKPTVALPGFALDMNRIWQNLLGRVLREWADGVEVREEFALRHVFQRNPGYPLRGKVPTPRPDFAAFVSGRLLAFLDAKYRDLWERPLPREMLYQLAVYATAQGRGAAAILYPCDSPQGVEQRLDICDPLSNAVRASVALRPVSLSQLEQLISAPVTGGTAERRSLFASSLLGDQIALGKLVRSGAAPSREDTSEPAE
jgi:5-methylcytosine-specific restriction enzyme subunit McrC